MRASVPRTAVCLLGGLFLGAFLFPTGDAKGQGILEGLAVSLQPALTVVSSSPSGNVYSANGDETIQLSVVASYSDGTTADVTTSTMYIALDPGNMTVTPEGQLTLSGDSTTGTLAVEIVYADQRHLAIFVVSR